MFRRHAQAPVSADVRPFRPAPAPTPSPAFDADAARPGGSGSPAMSPRVSALCEALRPAVFRQLQPSVAQALPPREVAGRVSDILIAHLDEEPEPLDLFEQRQLVAALTADLLSAE